MTVRHYNEIIAHIHGEPDNFPITLYYYNLARKIRAELYDMIFPASGKTRKMLEQDYRFAIKMMDTMYDVECDQILALDAHRILEEYDSFADSSWLMGIKFIPFARKVEALGKLPDKSLDVTEDLNTSDTVAGSLDSVCSNDDCLGSTGDTFAFTEDELKQTKDQVNKYQIRRDKHGNFEISLDDDEDKPDDNDKK